MKVKFDTYIRENIEIEEYNSVIDDYGIKKNVSNELIKMSNKAINQFKEDIDLFDDIEIIFVENIGGLLGKFRSGTASSTPIILLSDTNILKASKKYNVSLETTMASTIYHELGHAICELEESFDYQFLNYDDEEEWVEDFAYDYYNYGIIPDELQEFIENKPK